MNRKEVVRQAMASMRMEGFEYTKEELEFIEKYANGEITDADYYRWCNNELPEGAIRARIAILECGHNPNMDNKKMPVIGKKIRCPFCKTETIVQDTVY